MTDRTTAAPETGYAPVNGLQMYYELHGDCSDGDAPLLLLHGGLFDIEQQFGALIPSLSAGRRVIATDFQGHGRTNDIDRPLGTPDLALRHPHATGEAWYPTLHASCDVYLVLHHQQTLNLRGCQQ